MRKIRAARDEIIQVAARMQSAGTDTSELTPPLVEIQEALAELESTGAAEVPPAHGGRMAFPDADDGGGGRDPFSGAQGEPANGLNSERAGAAAAVMGLIADKTRLQILACLAEGELSVGEICTRLRCAQPAVSHHLALLRQAGIVAGRRDKKWVYYRLGARARCVAPGVIDVAVDAASVRLTLPMASSGFGAQ